MSSIPPQILAIPEIQFGVQVAHGAVALHLQFTLSSTSSRALLMPLLMPQLIIRSSRERPQAMMHSLKGSPTDSRFSGHKSLGSLGSAHLFRPWGYLNTTLNTYRTPCRGCRPTGRAFDTQLGDEQPHVGPEMTQDDAVVSHSTPQPGLAELGQVPGVQVSFCTQSPRKRTSQS